MTDLRIRNRTAAVALGSLFLILMVGTSWAKEKKTPPKVDKDKEAAALFEKGEKFEKEGNLDEAVSTYQTLLKDYPDAAFFCEGPGGCTNRDTVNERLKVIDCRKLRKEKYRSYGTPEELWRELRSALEKRDPKQLVKLASCDFREGKCATELASEGVLDEKYAAWMFKHLKGFDFTKAIFFPNYGADPSATNVNVSKKGGVVPEEHSFDFQKFGGGWVWVGYCWTLNNPF
jgi:hypothetical protein